MSLVMFYVMDLYEYYEYRKLSNLAQNYSGWNSCASLDKRGKKISNVFYMYEEVSFFSKVLCNTKCLGFSKPMFLFPHCTVMCCSMYKSTFLLARDSYGVK